ncbi:MAG: hypothetical protein A2X12_02935 [Bacteroidetes bacterium GWE2_29_8]|nr:MAG: hypothetical protein A2X12_02935 [Bacteroidetes bacterium GWE2_29_8]OFY15369.1 MAG: hypothetical protein A2X02_02950 [Bacteroidetes bacterium GWF2_29_10]
MLHENVKIILADDHELFRSGIKLILTREKIADVIAEASNGIELINLIKSNYNPDIILIDISMPEMNGFEATKELIKINSNFKIIAFTMYGEEDYFCQMLEAGVKGFILKTIGIDELKFAIKEIMNNKPYFSQELLNNYLTRSLNKINDNNHNNNNILSDREKQILILICQGKTNEDIAEKLCLSPNTIKTYRNKLLEKTKCNNTATLVMHAIKNGIIQV